MRLKNIVHATSAVFMLVAFFAVFPLEAGTSRETVVLEKTKFSFPWRNASDTSKVVRVSIFAPESWKGRRVRFEVPYALHKCDLILSLNGKKVGEIYRPAGEVDLSDHLKYGATNELSWILTQSGKQTSRGESKTVDLTHKVRPGMGTDPVLSVTPRTFIRDIFANTSWRKKTLFIEAETDGASRLGAELEVEIFDAGGKLVKMAKGKVAKDEKTVLSIPWKNPNVWELSRPYLYTCKAKLSTGDAFPEFKFGFREVWREGKELKMNGHPLHLRPCYSYGAGLVGAKFLADIGYNLLAYCHTIDACTLNDKMITTVKDFDSLGMGMFVSCGGALNIVRNRTQEDPETARLYREFQKTFHRLTRNHPSILGAYVTQMIICDNAPHNPVNLGMYESSSARDKLIGFFCDINREYNPNIIYYSHADGNNGDLASGNLYLNWTPLQEKEEWLSLWAKEGKMPWCSVEFGQPYGGCWYWRQLFVPTEHLASIYGPRAYSEERYEVLPLALEIGSKNKTGHGSAYGSEILTTKYPLLWDLRRIWTWKVNSRWRAFGHYGGNIYFNLRGAYGTPPGTKGYGRYGEMKEEVPRGVKPDWANEAYDIHQLGNKDFCGFIGGAPDFADNTRAYRSGEKIVKQAVLIWDGFGEKSVTVKIRASSICREINATLEQGEIKKLPFEIIAPNVMTKTPIEVKVDFVEGGKTVASDTLTIDIYPSELESVDAPAKKVYLFDPAGDDAKLLTALGIKYETVKNLSDFDKTDAFLIIGRNALAGTVLGDLGEKMKAGLRILVMAQKPDTWQSMGFDIQDAMTREVFPASKTMKEKLSNDELRLWRGAPSYGEKEYGYIMTHSTLRGPRWTRRHVVAGIMLKIPPRIGFTPLLNGLFDLEYSPLLRFAAGKGSITFCTLDLQRRVPCDPAASKTAKVVFEDFFNQKARKAVAAGALSGPIRLKAEKVHEGGKVYLAKSLDSIFGTDHPQLRRWTAPLEVKVDEDGTFELPEKFFAEKAKVVKDEEKPMYLFNQMKVNRLCAAVATSRGCEPDDLVTRRIFYQAGKSSCEPLSALHVCGPFAAKADDSKLMLDTVWNAQVEEMARAGDYNPNFEFPLPQGGTANWRPQLSPDKTGCFNFNDLSANVQNPVYYATVIVNRKTAGRVRMKLGADWRLTMYVNGKEEFRCEAGAHFAKFEVFVPLKAGANVISFKLGGGRSGCKLWALLERETSQGVHSKANPELDAVMLYDNLIHGFDPYQFHYW